MTTPLDTDFGIFARDIINEFGKTISVTTKTGGVYSAGAGSNTGETKTTHSVKVSPPFPADERIFGNGYIQGAMSIYVARLDNTFTPSMSDIYLLDGLEYGVSALMPLYSGDLIAAYAVQLKQV